MSATVIKTRSGASAASLYVQDFYGWTLDQAAKLRDGRATVLDLHNLAEEIEDLGRSEFYRLESAFRIVLLHMLKWDHQAELQSRSWHTSIVVQRLEIERIISSSPSLRPRQAEAVAHAYRRARIEAAGETGLPRSAFPAECPYTLDEIVKRPFEWPGA